MEEAGLAPNYDALKLVNFDFAAYAELCGGMGINVEENENIIPAIKKAKLSNKPTIINAHVTAGELSLPPNLNLSQAKNFGVSKAKELWKALKGDKDQWENIKDEVSAYFDK